MSKKWDYTNPLDIAEDFARCNWTHVNDTDPDKKWSWERCGEIANTVDSLHTRLEAAEADCAGMRVSLAKIAEYHFDKKGKDYACGGGCDMGDSGHEIDERGHDVDCVFAVATKALSRPTGSALLARLEKLEAVALAAKHAVSAHYENHCAEVMMLILKGEVDALAALDEK